MIIITEKEVKNIIPAKDIQKIIDAVEGGFADYARGDVQMPPKQYLDFKECGGDLRIMPSYSQILKLAGTKIVNVHPENPQKGLPTVMAVVVLNDARDGRALALIEAAYITGIRTGAAGAIAAKYLAKKNTETLGVVGAGQQAFFQIAAITKVRKIKEVLVYDTKEENIIKLADSLKELGIEIKKASLEETAKTDILTTTTPSRNPIIKNEWIKPGTHINAIGADAPGKEELDPIILKRAKIVIDNWEQASHSGEINVPIEKGIIKKEDIYSDLGNIVIGKTAGRENDTEITVFDSTGLGFQDLYTANLVYQYAIKNQ
ncbi:MAG: ornithine cyclodeaminase family protein [Candidatus Nealsonbacteria bacterium]|nr:ornithine cyclodeaminase family protein [Candidatus Nealsonbacteria bacterium]